MEDELARCRWPCAHLVVENLEHWLLGPCSAGGTRSRVPQPSPKCYTCCMILLWSTYTKKRFFLFMHIRISGPLVPCCIGMAAVSYEMICRIDTCIRTGAAADVLDTYLVGPTAVFGA